MKCNLCSKKKNQYVSNCLEERDFISVMGLVIRIRRRFYINFEPGNAGIHQRSRYLSDSVFVLVHVASFCGRGDLTGAEG